MIIALVLVNFLYAALFYLLFPWFWWLWAVPIVFNFVLAGLVFGDIFEIKKVDWKELFGKHLLVGIWYVILLGLGIAGWYMFGNYVWWILIGLNLVLWYLSFAIDYQDWKTLFEIGFLTVLAVIWVLGWLQCPSKFLELGVAEVALVVASYAFLYFIGGIFWQVEKIFLWKLFGWSVLLVLLFVILKGRFLGVGLVEAGILILTYVFLILAIQLWMRYLQGKPPSVQKPDLEEVLEGKKHVIEFTSAPKQKSEWLQSMIDFFNQMPASFKFLLGILVFVGYGLVIAGWAKDVYLQQPIGWAIFLLGLVLFVVDVILIFVLGYQKWWYRFLIAVLLNLSVYFGLYVFFEPKRDLMIVAMVAWTFLQVILYWIGRNHRHQLNLWMEDMVVAMTVNWIVIILNFVLMLWLLSFPRYIKISWGLLYLGLQGFLSYYFFKLIFEKQETPVDEDQIW